MPQGIIPARASKGCKGVESSSGFPVYDSTSSHSAARSSRFAQEEDWNAPKSLGEGKSCGGGMIKHRLMPPTRRPPRPCRQAIPQNPEITKTFTFVWVLQSLLAFMQHITKVLYPLLTLLLVIVVAFLAFTLVKPVSAPMAVLRPSHAVADDLDSLLTKIWFPYYSPNEGDTADIQPYLKLIELMGEGGNADAATTLARQILPGLGNSDSRSAVTQEQIAQALLARLFVLQDSILRCNETAGSESRCFALNERVKEGEPFVLFVAAYYPHRNNDWVVPPKFYSPYKPWVQGTTVGEGKMQILSRKVSQPLPPGVDTLEVKYAQTVEKRLDRERTVTDTCFSRFEVTR